jgi:hypothetical protein
MSKKERTTVTLLDKGWLSFTKTQEPSVPVSPLALVEPEPVESLSSLLVNESSYILASEPSGTSDTVLHTQDLLPTVFQWKHGGEQVLITGTFNSWSSKVPMERSGNVFSYNLLLSREIHDYKFIVDGEWRIAPEQPTVMDSSGNINNFLDLSTFATI